MSKKFYFEGNIAALKSTIIQRITNNIQTSGINTARAVPEPVDRWERDGMLKAFYEKRIGIDEFHDYIYRVKREVVSVIDGSADVLLMERSESWSDPVFRKASGVEVKPPIFDDDYHVMLKSSPGKCFKRLHNRNRTSEMTIAPDYLERVSEAYESVVPAEHTSKLFVIDIDTVSGDDGNIPKHALDAIVDSITNFIYSNL